MNGQLGPPLVLMQGALLPGRQAAPAQGAHPLHPDSAHAAHPAIAQHAVVVLRDSLTTLPDRAEDWVARTAGQLARLFPRLVLALVAAIIVLAISAWVRRALLRHQEATGTVQPADGLGFLGTLAAAAVAAAIIGASTLAAALFTFLVFYLAAVCAQIAGERVFRRSHVGPGAIELLLSVLRTALITVGAVEALSTVGLNLTGVIASLGIAGLAVGFAAQDSLANLIAGFTILWDRPLRIDDWIQVGDSPPGRVRHLTLRTTRLETIDLGILIIPNKEITGSRLFNYSLVEGGRLRMYVGVAADADLEQARRALVEAATQERDISRTSAPTVNVAAISDTAVTLELVVTVPDLSRARALRSSILERVVATFRARGLKYMAPSPPPEAGRGPW